MIIKPCIKAGVGGMADGAGRWSEIPAMLLAGRYSLRIGNRRLMLTGVSGVLCGGHYYRNKPLILFLAQIPNALFIGISMIGMTCFQDSLPGYAGQVSTLFSNSIRCGGIVAGMLAGTITEWFRFDGVFLCARTLWHVRRYWPYGGSACCSWRAGVQPQLISCYSASNLLSADAHSRRHSRRQFALCPRRSGAGTIRCVKPCVHYLHASGSGCNWAAAE